MDKKYAEHLLNKTKEDYNLISNQFSSTRQFFWRDLEYLIHYTSSGDKVLDLGCGNGRLLGIFKERKINIDYIGVDNSDKLVEEAKKNFPGVNFQIANALKLPFPENYFDKVYSIAVLHHIPSKELRSQFLKEIKRVLRPGGLLILTVWNLWRRKTACKSFFENAFLKIIGKSKLDFKDTFYPWKSNEGKTLAQRYFHLFTRRELKKI
jgi:ubiquinone/menaquinone biosynthesis C-methylase UbiE